MEGSGRLLLSFRGLDSAEMEGCERTVTVKLSCAPIQYSVVFDYNGGHGDISGKEVFYHAPYGRLPQGEREGSAFRGWSLDITGEQMVWEDTVVENLSGHVLYAVWETCSYRVSFDAAGGTCEMREWVPKSYEVCFDPDGGSCGEKYRTVTYDALYGTLPEPERTGYAFARWFLADGNRVTEHTAVTITKDSDLTAAWMPNYYRITFNAAGGECGAEAWSYAYDDYFRELPKAVKAGHVFCGWYTSKEGGERYMEGRKVDILSDMTLYAHWEKAEPAPEDDWYIYPDSPDREEKPHRITMEEAAGKYGFTVSQIRTAMNLYQMEPGVAGSLLQTAKELGADASLALWDPDVLEKKRSGRDVAGSSFSLFKARIKKATQNSVTITWNRIRGADGYLIYDSRCGRMEHFAFDAETAGTSCTKKGLKKGTYYRFIVTAYALIDGRRVPIAVSTNVHAVTKGGKYANAKKITLKKTHKTMRAGEKWKIKVKVSYGKKQHKTHRKLSFESSDPGVAKVDDRGIVKAAAKGECRIYVYDQGGRFRKIRIKVKG